MKIGIFDSGLGGLLILKKIRERLPQYDYVYYGDNARVPYGNRSKKIIYQFTKEAIEFLFKKDCQLVILACNTATSNALRQIQRQYLPHYYPDRRVLGVIIPTIEYLKDNQNIKTLAVIATSSTVNSKSFTKEIRKINNKIKVYEKACPLLVPYIESGIKNKKILQLILKEYLKVFFKKKIDLLILGCTHYGLIKKEIIEVIGRKIKVIDQAQLIAERLFLYLKNHQEIKDKLSKKGKVEYFFSDFNKNYQKLMRYFLEK